mmetsp:Transcript_33847/g.70353  ORF Transcript_33847/g.70353 Transcript_33847/m.70353 type:complete len:101 (-) Transcript_33847:139-441(-)
MVLSAGLLFVVTQLIPKQRQPEESSIGCWILGVDQTLRGGDYEADHARNVLRNKVSWGLPAVFQSFRHGQGYFLLRHCFEDSRFTKIKAFLGSSLATIAA